MKINKYKQNTHTMKTKNFQESFETINYFLQEKGLEPITEYQAKSDWAIVGGEDVATLSMYVNDYASEVHSERCAAKDEWRYQY